MPDRIAIKRLTASDLTFFESLFRTLKVGNQKAINLNADVFVERLYPALPGLISTLSDVIPISLTLLGPAGATAHVISRAITKRDAYKNWRLNGEFIRDPDGEPGRFNVLAPGDLAVMEFIGDPGPQRLTLLLIAAGSHDDAELHAALEPLVSGSNRTMVEISRAEIATAASRAAPSHPIWQLAADPEFDAALEDAVQGGIKGTTTIRAKVARPVSAATLAAAKAAAEKNGRDGEALAWIQIQKMRTEGSLSSAEWSSKANAVSPFDFQTVENGGATVRIDAKSTAGEFNRLIHMSAAELTAAVGGDRYDLWRIYKIEEDGARLRISKGISKTAKAVLDGITLPVGVTIDSVSIDPALLTWEPEILIKRPDDSSSGE